MCVWNSLVFQIVWRSRSCSLYLGTLEKGLQLKTTAWPINILSVLTEVFEELNRINNRIGDHLGKCSLFSDLRYGFRSSQSTADLLKVVADRIFSAFNRSEAGFGVLVLFTHLSWMEFQVRYLDIFCHFSVIDTFRWFWKGSLHKNTELFLEFLKALFLVLPFSCYIFMIFLMMLSVTLRSMEMILFSTVCVIRNLIYGNN